MSYDFLMTIRKTILLLLAAFSTHAGATQLLIEPYLSYTISAKYSEPNKTPTASGMTYGGRLGGDYQGFQFGVDYMTGSWTDDQNPQDTITPSNFGIFLGFKFPAAPVRIYGDYFFNEEYKFKRSNGSDNYEGTEFRFGLGLTMLPVVNINFEYGMGTLTTDNGTTMNQTIKVSYYGIGISVPLEF